MGKQYEYSLKGKRELWRAIACIWSNPEDAKVYQEKQRQRRAAEKRRAYLQRMKMRAAERQQYQRLWRANNPEKVRAYCEKQRLLYAKNSEKAKREPTATGAGGPATTGSGDG